MGCRVASEEGGSCSEGPVVLQTTWIGGGGGVGAMCELESGTWKEQREQKAESGGGEMKERRDTWARPDRQAGMAGLQCQVVCFTARHHLSCSQT